MAKYISILLLFSLAFSMTIDVSVVDAAELEHHYIEDNHQELSKSSEHKNDVDYHCSNHTMHHGITLLVSNEDSTKRDNQTYYSYQDEDVGLHIAPATPPPLAGSHIYYI